MRAYNDRRQYPTASEVERIRETLTRAPQTSSQIGRASRVPGDLVGIALRALKAQGIATVQGDEPQLWSLRRGTA